MKEKKTIRIKNPHLRNLRNNLRLILLKAEGKKSSELEDLALSFYYDENKKPLKNITTEVKKKSSKFRQEVKELERSLRKSICYCPVCGQIDKDMTYNPQIEKWYCVECY